MKNNNQELVCQKLDYVKFYNNAIQSGFKIIQVDEFNINRGTVSNMAWIKKGYPAFMLQEAPAEKYSVLAAISNTSLERVVVRKGNTNGIIFVIFLQDLIDDLIRKYDEYFAKIIITCDGAKYHSVELISQILTREEMMMVVTVPYT